MFGYVIANLEGLTQAQKDRYKGCYCGLCRVLKQRHGFSGRLTLTYDMTFLVLLLSALYEADEERGMEICPAHPLRKHFYWQTRYTEYAADMNVVLAYNNCRDDWQRAEILGSGGAQPSVCSRARALAAPMRRDRAVHGGAFRDRTDGHRRPGCCGQLLRTPDGRAVCDG